MSSTKTASTKTAAAPGADQATAKPKKPGPAARAKARAALLAIPQSSGPLATRYIDPALIDRRPGWNPRIDFGEIELLAGSIKAQKAKDGHGLINDIRVKDSDVAGRFILIDGDRRMTAVELLIKRGEVFGIGIPAKVEPADGDELAQLIRMFTANTGKAFLPIEEAQAFKLMKESGMTLKEIEQETGRSDNAIVGALALLESDDSLQEAVKGGKISGALAKSIAVNARGDKVKQAELTAQAVAAGTDKSAKKAVRRAVDDSRRAKAAKKGLKLKMRALGDDELSAIGERIAGNLADRVRDAGMDLDTDFRAWMKKDENLKLAFTFGALEALKAAAGQKISLDV